MTKKEHMKDKTDAELTKLLAHTRLALREARFGKAGARPADAAAPRKLRVAIAQVLTEQCARSITPATA